MFRAFTALVILLASGSVLASTEARTYLIGPRDVLHVEVYGEPDCTREVVVSESGEITLPYIGGVPVAGKSIDDVKRLVAERYLDGILLHPEIAVSVKSYRSQPYQVLGAVNKPGNYFVDRPLTLREALGEAGWIDTEKSTRQIAVRSQDGQRTVLSIDEVAGIKGDLPIRPGDVISVEQGQWVYVSGEVEEAGEVVYYDGLTVWQALARAGGPAETARLRRAYLVREDGERITVNLKRIEHGRDPDVLLQPGDRLVIKESPL